MAILSCRAPGPMSKPVRIHKRKPKLFRGPTGDLAHATKCVKHFGLRAQALGPTAAITRTHRERATALNKTGQSMGFPLGTWQAQWMIQRPTIVTQAGCTTTENKTMIVQAHMELHKFMARLVEVLLAIRGFVHTCQLSSEKLRRACKAHTLNSQALSPKP